MARKKSVQKQASTTRKSYNLRSKSKGIEIVNVKIKSTKMKRKKPVTQENQPTPKAKSLEKIQSDHCTVCLNTNNFKQKKTMDCGHTFHSRCINNWLKVSITCPVCRKTIKRQSQSPFFQEALPQPLATEGTQQNLPQLALFIRVYRRQQFGLF